MSSCKLYVHISVHVSRVEWASGRWASHLYYYQQMRHTDPAWYHSPMRHCEQATFVLTNFEHHCIAIESSLRHLCKLARAVSSKLDLHDSTMELRVCIWLGSHLICTHSESHASPPQACECDADTYFGNIETPLGSGSCTQ